MKQETLAQNFANIFKIEQETGKPLTCLRELLGLEELFENSNPKVRKAAKKALAMTLEPFIEEREVA